MERIKLVSNERTERLAWLARIELTEEEKRDLTVQLNRILDSFKDLDKLDLTGVKPTFHALSMTNCLREDKEEPCLSQKEAIASGSKVKDGFFVAPKIF
jgi:aspartyl-tRNA(Asn)/glutamyl-tRNA(Gln) amidotransferase subunit C